MKGLDDGLVVICDRTMDMSQTKSINPNDKTNYWFITVVLIAVVCLLLLVVIVDKWYMKRGLTIPCVLLY